MVFSLRLAKTLQKMGFTLIKTEPNKKRPKYNVYLFENSTKLQSAIKQALYNKNPQHFVKE